MLYAVAYIVLSIALAHQFENFFGVDYGIAAAFVAGAFFSLLGIVFEWWES